VPGFISRDDTKSCTEGGSVVSATTGELVPQKQHLLGVAVELSEKSLECSADEISRKHERRAAVLAGLMQRSVPLLIGLR
jgi:hypothetical protein